MIDKEFELLMKHFPRDYPSTKIGFGKVQCLIWYRLCSDLHLEGYPLFVFYSPSREPLIYKKARRFQSMTQWIVDKMNTKLLSLSPSSAVTEHDFITNHYYAMIGYHFSLNNIKILDNVLHHHADNVQFAVFQNDSESDSMSMNAIKAVDEEETLVFYRDGMEWISMTHSKDTNTFSRNTIQRFIDYGLLPIIEELNPSNFQNYIHSKSPIFWLWVDIDRQSVNQQIFSILEDVMSYRRIAKLEPFGCVYSDSHRYSTHFHSLHLNGSGPFPQALFMFEERKYHYPHNQANDFSFDSVMAFLESVMDTDHRQKIENNIRFGTRSLPSEYGHPLNAPIDAAEDAVIAINTEYHDHIVYDTSMAVVVQYYARWSERCKHFAADYRKVGAAFHKAQDVLITKLNIVRNDPPFYLSDVPVVVLYYKGRGDQYVVYEGLLHSKPIIKWINEHRLILEHEPKNVKLKFA